MEHEQTFVDGVIRGGQSECLGEAVSGTECGRCERGGPHGSEL